MAKDWKDLREDAERLAHLYGVINFARKIPAGRSTVYRILNDQVTPCKAIQQNIERMVAEEKASQLAQSSDSDD